ncbi:hypothetical protein P691DRAFT_790421 [Macrolepiota fuliginosa MF-IS2]|uniref:Uncharacterized protein n=1 Tax=Macrolepiota fuliginosa MF-IS2 TaxID=1400762 RepID=A0A9P6CAC4_9AGAR|nr:hypothetical protein P691DRAFT_790421 [Macrolepiota fuliginosa MF-IS2]
MSMYSDSRGTSPYDVEGRLEEAWQLPIVKPYEVMSVIMWWHRGFHRQRHKLELSVTSLQRGLLQRGEHGTTYCPKPQELCYTQISTVPKVYYLPRELREQTKLETTMNAGE